MSWIASLIGLCRWGVSLLTWGFCFCPLGAEIRTWTHESGTQIEAELTGVEAGMALLQKDGRLFRVPFASLSAEDQAFLRAWKPGAPSVATPVSVPAANPKKGFCLSSVQYPDWVDRVRALNVSWFYQWKAEETAGMPESVEFVPMIFGKAGRITSSVDYVLKHKDTLGFQYVLGYNEPDKTDQANMTVEAALEAWPEVMSSGLPLVSPAAAHPEGEWMEAFMRGAKERGYKVDYIAIHSYGGANAVAFLAMLERVHRKFELPLWITEFAVADWQADDIGENQQSTASVEDFMEAVLPKLDRLKYVHRYAWFSADPTDAHLGTSALFNADGSLTKLGQIYARH